MTWTKYQIILAVLFIVFGCWAIVSAKWLDTLEAPGVTLNHRLHKFDHPYLQVFAMFIGEFLCLPIFYVVKFYHRQRGSHMEGGSSRFNWFIALPASLLDMCAATLLLIGLNLSISSSYILFRGAPVIFTGLLSVAFLGRYIRGYMWMGLLFILVGLMTVGVGDAVYKKDDFEDKNAVVAGFLLIIIGEVVAAGLMVYREYYVLHNNVHPLKAVGLEGMFGVLVLGVLLLLMNRCTSAYPPFTSDSGGKLENLPDAFLQMRNNHTILILFLGLIIATCGLNFTFMALLKEVWATSSMVIGSLSAMAAWPVFLIKGWHPKGSPTILIQAAGYVLVVLGVCIYNDFIFAPFLKKRGCLSPEEPDPDAFVPQLDPRIGGPSANQRNPANEESEPLLSHAVNN